MPSPTHIPRVAVNAPFWKGMGLAALLSIPLWGGIFWAVRLALS